MEKYCDSPYTCYCSKCEKRRNEEMIEEDSCEEYEEEEREYKYNFRYQEIQKSCYWCKHCKGAWANGDINCELNEDMIYTDTKEGLPVCDKHEDAEE